MPHKQKHRGQHSNDPKLFHPDKLPVINEAVDDLSFLLSRGYSDNSSLKIVGDRYRLTQRQRKAVLRASCSNEALVSRQIHTLEASQITGKSLAIDGYNLLITIESGLGGGIVLNCRDGCFRDIASVHGTYRKVEETLPALHLIGQSLKKLKVKEVIWYLDKPVSNSGRLKQIILAFAAKHDFKWKVYLVNSPDKEMAGSEDRVSISSDGWVIDHSKSWFNLAKHIINQIPQANVIYVKGHLSEKNNDED